MTVAVRTATGSDLTAVHALLREAGLPVPQPGEPPVEFLVAEEDGALTACAGWERYGDEALVRSVAVRADRRGRGVGRALIERVDAELVARGVRGRTLVTMSAAPFFASLGFRPIPRADVPAAVQASPEFGLHCCAQGTWMRREA